MKFLKKKSLSSLWSGQTTNGSIKSRSFNRKLMELTDFGRLNRDWTLIGEVQFGRLNSNQP